MTGLYKDELICYKYLDKQYIESIEEMWTRVSASSSLIINNSEQELKVTGLFIKDGEDYTQINSLKRKPNKHWYSVYLKEGTNFICTADSVLNTTNKGLKKASSLNLNDVITTTSMVIQEEPDKEGISISSAWSFGVLNFGSSVVDENTVDVFILDKNHPMFLNEIKTRLVNTFIDSKMEVFKSTQNISMYRVRITSPYIGNICKNFSTFTFTKLKKREKQAYVHAFIDCKCKAEKAHWESYLINRKEALMLKALNEYFNNTCKIFYHTFDKCYVKIYNDKIDSTYLAKKYLILEAKPKLYNQYPIINRIVKEKREDFCYFIDTSSKTFDFSGTKGMSYLCK